MTATPVSDAQAPLNVRRILRVNHAGEYGAIRIYQSQLLVARLLAPDLVPFLTETLSHEIKHRQRFRDLMTPRGVYPCGALPVWGVGGYAMGLATGVFGRDAILVCTEAVERTVHAHLGEQLASLGNSDEEVASTIRSIQQEELGHLDHAVTHRASNSPFLRWLSQAISAATATLIWLSTYGEARFVRR